MTTTLRFSDTTKPYPTLDARKTPEQVLTVRRALRGLGRDVLKTPLHWLAMDLALDAYQSLVTDHRIIGVPATGERIAVADLILSEKPEHTKPRADLIVLTAERLGLPAKLLAQVVAGVLKVKDAQAAVGAELYRAVMKARELDDVQYAYVYDDEGGYGQVDVWSRKERIAQANAKHASRAVKPAARKVEPAGLGARLMGMFH